MRSPKLLLPLLLLAAPACGGGGGGGTGGSQATPVASTCPLPTPLATPHFRADVLPALQHSCGGEASTTQCHGGIGIPQGHVSFYTGQGRTADDVHAELLAAPSNAPNGYFRVAPQDLPHSWIIEKVTQDQPGGAGYGARMPLSAPNLCQATVDNLKAWIQQGAAND